MFAVACSAQLKSRPLSKPYQAKSNQYDSGSGNMCSQEILASNFSSHRFHFVETIGAYDLAAWLGYTWFKEGFLWRLSSTNIRKEHEHKQGIILDDEVFT